MSRRCGGAGSYAAGWTRRVFVHQATVGVLRRVKIPNPHKFKIAAESVIGAAIAPEKEGQSVFQSECVVK
jgi:hypothetical protein